MGQFSQDQKGFSLLEVLIAAAIFAFAVAGILSLFTKCSLLDQANRNKGIATNHAETVMEDIMEYMKDHEPSSVQEHLADWTWNSVSVLGVKLNCTAPYIYPCILGNESIATTYSDADPTNHPPMVTVTVRWKDRELENERSLSLITFISKRG